MITITSIIVTTMIVTMTIFALIAIVWWRSGFSLPVAEKHKHAWTIVRTTESTLHTDYLLFCTCGETDVVQLDGKEVRGRTIANSILEKMP